MFWEGACEPNWVTLQLVACMICVMDHMCRGMGAAENKIIQNAWNNRVIRDGDMLGQPGDDASASTHANQYSSAGVLKSGWRSLGI